MVHACQKKGICLSKQIKNIAKKISKKDAKDFAKTKHKGLPNKLKKNNLKKKRAKRKFASFKEYFLYKEGLI